MPIASGGPEAASAHWFPQKRRAVPCQGESSPVWSRGRCGLPSLRDPTHRSACQKWMQPGECLYHPHSVPQRQQQTFGWVPPPTPPQLQKPLCSGSACPNLPLGPLRGPGKKSASLLISMCPSNTVIHARPPPPPCLSAATREFTNGITTSTAAAGRGVQVAPQFTSFSCPSWWAWPLPCPFLQLCSAFGTPSPCPSIYRAELGMEGFP